MPVRGEYRWNETSDSLRIEIPLKGVSPKKVDIFVSTSVLKVNYSPYLVEIFLLKEVDAVKHKATVKDGLLTITLKKKIPEHWGNLEISLEEYERDQKKEQILKKKQEAIEERTALEQKLAAEATDRKITEERHAVKQQMALDEEFRNRLDQLKADEKKAAEEEVYRTFAELQQNHQNFAKPSTTHNAPATTSSTTTSDHVKTGSSTFVKDKEDSKRLIHEDVLLESYDMIDDMDEDEMLSPQKQSSSITSADRKQGPQDVVQSNDGTLDEEEEEGEVIETEADDIKYIPPPRHQTLENSDNSKVKINFTPRLFPTPMRESKAAEEEDWIAKNRRHLKRHGVLGKGLSKKGGANTANDVSEEDPVWLKAKGDDFFRNGDIRSALNAYSAAIDAYDVDFTLFTANTASTGTTPSPLPKLEANLIACLSNRSLCYLKLNLSQDCKLDCDIIIKAVQLQFSDLPPPPLPSTSSTDTASVNDNHQVERMKLCMTSIKLLLRRGLVHCQLGKYSDSLADYTQAHVIMQQQLTAYYLEQLSHNFHITIETIQSDINRLKMILTAENAKKKGDLLFADRAIDDAIEQYSHAIELIPIYVSAYSNRSACYLMKNQLELSINDCNFALEILTLKEDEELHHHQHPSSSTSSSSSGPAVINFSTKTISSSSSISSSNFQVLRAMLHAIIPLPNTDKHKQWLLNISLKKAVALIQSQRYEEAIEVYERLQTLDPQNETIKQDLSNLRLKFHQQIEERKGEKEKEEEEIAEKDSSQSSEKRSSGITDLDEVE